MSQVIDAGKGILIAKVIFGFVLTAGIGAGVYYGAKYVQSKLPQWKQSWQGFINKIKNPFGLKKPSEVLEDAKTKIEDKWEDSKLKANIDQTSINLKEWNAARPERVEARREVVNKMIDNSPVASYIKQTAAAKPVQTKLVQLVKDKPVSTAVKNWIATKPISTGIQTWKDTKPITAGLANLGKSIGGLFKPKV
jgi:hypothetical protein